MRKFLLRGEASPDQDLLEVRFPGTTPKAVAWRAVIAAEGPKCAAFLVGQHRRQLRAKGAHRFELWRAKKLPTWFFVAVEFLRGRAGWEVEKSDEREGLLRVWTVKWINRGYFRSIVLGMRSPS